MINKSKIDIDQCLAWYAESEYTQQDWKQDSWRDSRFVDGKQYTDQQEMQMLRKGINPITINRVFSVLQMARGHQINNRTDIVAKGRTQHDAEMAQTMTQAIEYVGDKNDLDARISTAFNSQICTGISFLSVSKNPDPNAEPVLIKPLPWYSIGWDIYSLEGPWLKPESCRYSYYSDWKDFDDVIARFPKKKNELEGFYGEAESFTGNSIYASTDFLEDFLSNNSLSGWTQTSGGTKRRRVKLVDMFYRVLVDRAFAKMRDGSVVELDDNMPAMEMFAVIENAECCYKALSPQMRLKTFAGRVELQDVESPFGKKYPFVPFVSYTDSYHQPYGVPRNLLEPAMELNKRRSMALSLISNRRTIMERSTATDHRAVFEEANKQDGFIVLEDGKLGTFEIQEMASMAPAQVDMMHQAEQEIKEVSGANDESLGYQTKVMSGVAIEEKKESSVTMLSPLFDNLSRSKKILGERIVDCIQREWTGQRVLLVTDRVTGAEKFMQLNEPMRDKMTGEIIVQNNINAGTFDVTIDNAGDSSSDRERQSNMLMQAMEHSAPELQGVLLTASLELSNLPNKDALMKQVRNVTKAEPIDTFLSASEQEEKDVQQQQAMEEQQQVEQQNIEEQRLMDLAKQKAEVDKIYADIQNEQQQTAIDAAKLETTQALNADKVAIDREKALSPDYLAGQEIAKNLTQSMGLGRPILPMAQPTDQTYPTR